MRIGGDIETDEDLDLFLEGLQEEESHTASAQKNNATASSDPFLESFDDPYGEEKKKQEKKKKRNNILDGVSTALSVASLIPGLDTFTNLAQIPVDLLRGDFIGAGLDLLGVIPIAGEIADAAKAARTANLIADTAKAAKGAGIIADTAKGMDIATDAARAVTKQAMQ